MSGLRRQPLGAIMPDDVERLKIHRHCPRCGSANVTARSHQCIVCGACGLNLYFNPCAAAGAIVLDSRDRALLARRAHEPAAGRLAFPGGFVDDGETAEEALRREIREEVGLEIDRFEYLASFPNTYPYAGVIYPTLDLFFLARVPDFDRAVALDGVSGLEFLPVDSVALDDLAFESLRAAWRVFIDRRR
jgi:ADP-ribose pyrophosphatase YjhB (NUDIX family)